MQQGYLLSGQYQIVDVLGSGGMATVYRGYEKSLDRDVAVKVITANTNAMEDYAERFNREAKIVAKLQHPSIIQIYFSGIDTIGSYVVMPLLTGGTLSERMKNATELISVREVGELALKVGQALHHAHKNDIIHRDIKFSNIMFDNEGNPYVMDFGIARLMSQTKLTMTGTFVGTPQFMAPEQWQGDVSAAVDQYALAVVLYELLSGNPPFEGSTAHELMFQHLQVEPEPVSTHRSDVPQEMVDALSRAMSKEPHERFPSILDFVETLNEIALSSGTKSTGFFTYPLKPKQPEPFRAPNPPTVPITGSNSGQIPPRTPEASSQIESRRPLNIIIPFLVIGIISIFLLMYFFNQQSSANATATQSVEETSLALATQAENTATQSAIETMDAVAQQETNTAPSATSTEVATEEVIPDGETQVVTQESTNTPTSETAVTDSPTATVTPSVTMTSSATVTLTSTPTATSTNTATATMTLTLIPTSTRRPSDTPTATATVTASSTVTPTSTVTATPTATASATSTATATTAPTNTPNPVNDLYQEGFDSEEDLASWQYDRDQWFVSTFDDRTVFESSAGISYPVIIQSPQGISGWTQVNPDDLFISMRFYLDRESVGLRTIFNYTERAYHAVEIAPGAITIKRNNDAVNIEDRGSERVIGTRQGLDLQIDTWHEVKVWANYETILVYLDDELVLNETDHFIATTGSVVPGDIILQTISPPWFAYIDEFLVQRVDSLSTHFDDAGNLPSSWVSDARNHASIEENGNDFYLELSNAGTLSTTVEVKPEIEFYCRLLNAEGGYQIRFGANDGASLLFDLRFGNLDIILVDTDGSENLLRNIPNFYGYNSWNLVYIQILNNEIFISRDGNARQNNALLPVSLEIDTLQFTTFEDDILQIDDCMIREVPQ